MGWNKRCKQIRKNVFQDNTDRMVDRSYETKRVKVIQTPWGQKIPRYTTESHGLHRQYRLIKKQVRRD